MNLKNAVIGGLIGGGIGAAVWTAVGFFTGYECGWVAWIVGLLAGVGVRSAVDNKTGVGAGLVAATIAFVAVLGGKFAVASFGAQRILAEIASAKNNPVDYSRAEAIEYICAELVEKYEDEGRLFEWPEDVDPDDAYMAEHYPEVIQEEAVATWDGMTPSQQETYKRDVIHEDLLDQARAFAGSGGEMLFLASFSPFDVLWLILALGTAFKAASRDDGIPSADANAENGTLPANNPSSPDAASSAPTGWRWPAASDQAVEKKSP